MVRLLCALPLALLLIPDGTAQPRAASPIETRLAPIIKASGAEVGLGLRTLDGKVELLLNADTSFHAASTMKVPVMVELFRQAREQRVSLDEGLTVTNTFHSVVDGSPYVLDAGDDSDADVYKRVGGTMSLRALNEAMITVSSNLATNLLIEKLGASRVQATVEALRIPGVQVLRGVEDTKAFEKGLNNTTTARGLLTLLEELAQGQVVSKEDSAAMIEVLKRQHFNEAIPAGVPPGTAVAHKTGEITSIHHDAAIVYAPRPYVLVILVRGIADHAESGRLMATLSKVVYEEVMR